jgi:hypothetical protein
MDLEYNYIPPVKLKNSIDGVSKLFNRKIIKIM